MKRNSARFRAYHDMEKAAWLDRREDRIRLAGETPSVRSDHALGRRDRQALLQTLMDGVKEFRETPFEAEGPLVAGIRSQLCLAGHRFGPSDRDAREIVNEAFIALGIQRPTWEQGQAEHTAHDGACLNCHAEIPDEARRMGRETRFCSAECAQSMRRRRNDEWSQRGSALARAAARAVKREKLPLVTCKQCEKTFRPFAINPSAWSYCSTACAGVARRVIPDIQCQTCGEAFRGRTADAKFCSKGCAGEAKQLPMRPCARCGTSFRPFTADRRFCTHSCSVASANAATEEKDCAWCGSAFLGSVRETLCSSPCGHAISKFRRGALKSVTPLAFDYMLRCQGVRITRPRITDALFSTSAPSRTSVAAGLFQAA